MVVSQGVFKNMYLDSISGTDRSSPNVFNLMSVQTLQLFAT